jgi:ribonucleoside-diphosphate reductase beta chain
VGNSYKESEKSFKTYFLIHSLTIANACVIYRMTIFDEQISRKPDRYPWVQDFISAMHEGFWTHKEFSFSSDVQDFKVNLDQKEKEIIIRTLSAIGQIEVAVKKFWAKLGDNLPHPSLTDLGYVMAGVEVIHNNAYQRLLEVLGMEDIFEQNLKLDVVSGRVNYLRKYTHRFYKDSKKQYVYALILFTLFIENVSLFSQFYIILWFGRYRNVLKDTTQQVTYTKNEELLHAKVGMKLVNVIRQECPELFDEELEQRILHEAAEAFKEESKIIDWIIGDFSAQRINGAILKEYVKGRINDSLKEIGFKSLFTIDKTIARDYEWMDEEVLANNAVDFFYQRPVDYAKKNKTFELEELV